MGMLTIFTFQLMLVSIPLLAIFLIDDLKNLKPRFRILLQCLLEVYMIFSTNIYLVSLGDLFGFGEIKLGIFSIPVTIFCVVGIMNAFNMMDGYKMVYAQMCDVGIAFDRFFAQLIYDSMFLFIIGSMIGFLIFNLGFFGKKRGVFLGDSGSNLIGFWVAWSAIYASQSEIYNIQPITMLWFVIIPFLDCIGLIFSRIKKGKSWTAEEEIIFIINLC